VHARYRTPGAGQVALRGFRQGKLYKQVIEVTLPEHEAGNAAIASMWARAKVDDLMWQYLAGLQSGNFPEALREEIVQTALAHRLMTQFTSFVAVEDRVVNEGGTQRTVSVPVEMPQGVRYDGIFGGAAEGEVMAERAMSAPASAYEKRAGTVLREASAQRHPLELRGAVAAHDESPPRTVPARPAPELQAP